MRRSFHPPFLSFFFFKIKSDGGVKDVTARYAKLWMSHTRKQRADEEWWRDSLGPFNTTPLTDEREEDDEIKGRNTDQWAEFNTS